MRKKDAISFDLIDKHNRDIRQESAETLKIIESLTLKLKTSYDQVDQQLEQLEQAAKNLA